MRDSTVATLTNSSVVGLPAVVPGLPTGDFLSSQSCAMAGGIFGHYGSRLDFPGRHLPCGLLTAPCPTLLRLLVEMAGRYSLSAPNRAANLCVMMRRPDSSFHISPASPPTRPLFLLMVLGSHTCLTLIIRCGAAEATARNVAS